MNPSFDPFFYKQPPTDFVEELKKPYHRERVFGYKSRSPVGEEICVNGLFIKTRFPEDKGLLDTAYADLEEFTALYGIGGDSFPIIIEKCAVDTFEEYTVVLDKTGFTIKAGDTEGVRRAIFYIEDRIKAAESDCLAPFTVTRKPFVKTRITRCFFSPTNRPPKNIDELFDEVDYYPDNFLSRLAHDGNNAVWIYTNFDTLLPSPVVEEYGEESEKRLKKLSLVVDKCERYGIKVYVFGCEPRALPIALREKYADLFGVNAGTEFTVCPRTERGRKHYVGLIEHLFRSVPKLGGFIDITAGERNSSCCSVLTWRSCPRCSRFSRGENLALTTSLITEGMRRAGAKGEFISWTYGHRYWNFDDIREYVRDADSDAGIMQNFDDLGYHEQLGRIRQSIDYWISYTGPSELFDITAEAAKKHGKRLLAKMQVCNSHEIATVPYIPVPSLIFDKYKSAYELGVSGILQCWYFGNYPSIMSKAAGELSFTQDFSDRDAFLTELASGLYGKSTAKEVVKAWEMFSEGYSNYPLNTMFSYYGPMHDGVVWELSLIPKNNPLSRTWLLTDKPNGDRIYECLNRAHTLDEAITLSKRMRDLWREGLRVLPSEERIGELYTLANALYLMISSGVDILEFYKEREKLAMISLGLSSDDPMAILEKMKDIVNKELQLSQNMIPIAKADVRLGYHSEAEGFKYFPEKIEYRMEKLRELLVTEFPEVEGRIKEGKAPLGFYLGEGATDGYILKDKAESAKREAVGSGSFYMYRDGKDLCLHISCKKAQRIVFVFEYMLMAPGAVLSLKDGVLDFDDIQDSLLCGYFGEVRQRELERYRLTETDDGYLIRIARDSYELTPTAPFKFRILVDGALWKSEDSPVRTLGKRHCSPGEFGWIIPEK